MALSGQLSDLSLAELIEFFCNQRKTGRLKIAYHRAPGYFYFDRGELVDAKIGALAGVEAVFYALTQENASFKFSTAFEATRRTIHQPWSHAVLEGLRRLDEGVTPKDAFPEGVHLAHDDEPDEVEEKSSAEKAASLKSEPAIAPAPQVAESKSAPLSLTVESSNQTGRSRTLVYAAVIAALVLSVAAIGFPAGWYGKRKVTANAPSPASEVKAETTAPSATDNAQPDSATTTSEEAAPAADASGSGAINNAAIRQQQEREARAAALAAQERAAAKQNATAQTSSQPVVNSAQANKPEAVAAAPQPQKKTVTVQVTYDEQGRVTQASGGDGMAQRIARQKRFPTGKGGSTTVTIPVN